MTDKELMKVFLNEDYRSYMVMKNYSDKFVNSHIRTLLSLAEQDRLVELYMYLSFPKRRYFSELTDLFPDIE